MRFNIEERRKELITDDTELHIFWGSVIGMMIFSILGFIIGTTLAAVGVGALGLLTGWASIGAGAGIYLLFGLAGCAIGGFSGYIHCKCNSNQATRIESLLIQHMINAEARQREDEADARELMQIQADAQERMRARALQEMNAEAEAEAEKYYRPYDCDLGVSSAAVNLRAAPACELLLARAAPPPLVMNDDADDADDDLSLLRMAPR
jgi:hypothetical protein